VSGNSLPPKRAKGTNPILTPSRQGAEMRRERRPDFYRSQQSSQRLWQAEQSSFPPFASVQIQCPFAFILSAEAFGAGGCVLLPSFTPARQAAVKILRVLASLLLNLVSLRLFVLFVCFVVGNASIRIADLIN